MTEIELMQKIGDNMAYELRECGITRQELADEIDVSKSTISRYIKGELMPSLKNIINMSFFLGCDIADLVNPNEPID